ncbi:AAA family ATPase [Tetraselmis virus 1]|uniref:AAA family ATPase n=1 Tax=Tetraselmis virus 1 TaxID=2060617 RepID=A0A2P0VNF3_9VIRU|nr:AAA family ATPase [Tetraselmis virus 1]AUF82437.1 AAA family ATPase [Tetraselmis virus 1]
MKTFLCFSTLLGRQLCVFTRHLLPEDSDLEYLCDGDIPMQISKEKRRKLKLPSIPLRSNAVHKVKFEGYDVDVCVETLIQGDVEKYIVTVVTETKIEVDRFIEGCTEFFEKLKIHSSNDNCNKTYLYDSGYWELLGESPLKNPECIFFTEESSKLVQDIIDFMTSSTVKEKYNRFGVAHKMNVLLHGPPGTGKTSLIEFVASKLKSDIHVINFSNKLRDDDLTIAMKKVNTNHPIIVMEDIDVLFRERKSMDSGRNSVSLSAILNTLDGISRPEGSVVFLTTNEVSSIDSAVLRSRRVDKVLKLDYAVETQTRPMIKYLIPEISESDVDRFISACGFDYTTADLHSYLFTVCDTKKLSSRDFRKQVSERNSVNKSIGLPNMYT